MTNDDQHDPLDGKGEDMIPEGGIPFDDIEEPAAQPDPEEDQPQDVSEGQPEPEEPASPAEEAAPEAAAEAEESASPPEPGAQPLSEEADQSLRLSEGDEDHGMSTGTEGIPAEEEDHGMGTGYPPIRDEDLPQDPGEAKADLETPGEEAIKGAPLFSPNALDADLVVKTEAPVQPKPIKADPEMLALLVRDEELIKLWGRADTAQEDVNKSIRNIDTSRQMLNQIQYGRNELLAGRDHFEEAERHINEVEFRVIFSDLVRKWTSRYGWLLFAWQVLFLIILFVILIGLGNYAFAGGDELIIPTSAVPTATIALPEVIIVDAETGIIQPAETPLVTPTAIPTPTPVPEHITLEQRASRFRPDLIYLIVTMLWAGIGGSVGAIFSLVQHITQDQDFDIQYSMWYIGSPFMGAAAGAGTYLIMRAGLLSLMESSADIQSPIIIYVLGFLVGYRHNVFIDLVRRVVNVFRFEEESKPTPAPGPTTKPDGNPPPPAPVVEENNPPEDESGQS